MVKVVGASSSVHYVRVLKQSLSLFTPCRDVGTCTATYGNVGCVLNNDNCAYGFQPYTKPDCKSGTCSCPCTCVKQDKIVIEKGYEPNCAADCLDRVVEANDVCYATSIDKCTSTNPYKNDHSGGSCGYGTMSKKQNADCPNCRCKIINGVCGIGKDDDSCTPSQNT